LGGGQVNLKSVSRNDKFACNSQQQDQIRIP
jgi:hypothetical protein